MCASCRPACIAPSTAACAAAPPSDPAGTCLVVGLVVALRPNLVHQRFGLHLHEQNGGFPALKVRWRVGWPPGLCNTPSVHPIRPHAGRCDHQDGDQGQGGDNGVRHVWGGALCSRTKYMPASKDAERYLRANCAAAARLSPLPPMSCTDLRSTHVFCCGAGTSPPRNSPRFSAIRPSLPTVIGITEGLKLPPRRFLSVVVGELAPTPSPEVPPLLPSPGFARWLAPPSHAVRRCSASFWFLPPLPPPPPARPASSWLSTTQALHPSPTAPGGKSSQWRRATKPFPTPTQPTGCAEHDCAARDQLPRMRQSARAQGKRHMHAPAIPAACLLPPVRRRSCPIVWARTQSWS